jgi:hypothetical protein
MAADRKDFKPFSDAISEPLRKAYVAGGFGLTLLTLGAILMLTAFFWQQQGLVRYVILGTGLALVLFTLAYVYLKELRRLSKMQTSVKQNKEMLDAIQLTAVELTELVFDLQSLAFKHASEVSQILASVRPFLRHVPLLSKVAESEEMNKAENLAQAIVDGTQKTRKVILDIKQALVESKPSYLKEYVRDLQKYKQEVETLLGSGESRAVAQ